MQTTTHYMTIQCIHIITKEPTKINTLFIPINITINTIINTTINIHILIPIRTNLL